MLILASASPRRRELLTQIQLPHRVIPAHIDESRHPDEAAETYVRRLASEKARAVAALFPDACVLAADTTVALDGAVLNKPLDLREAEAMLRSLEGRTHTVHTGLAVIHAGQELSHVESTDVTFSSIAPGDLAIYLASRDSLDKAGAYGIQGYAARWVTRIEGDFFNVVGLPLAAVVELLRQTKTL